MNDWYQQYEAKIKEGIEAINAVFMKATHIGLSDEVDSLIMVAAALLADAVDVHEQDVFAAVDAYHHWKREANRLLAAVSADITLSESDAELLKLFIELGTNDVLFDAFGYKPDELDAEIRLTALRDRFAVTITQIPYPGGKATRDQWQTTPAGLRLLELQEA